jgi:hypothetical protein
MFGMKEGVLLVASWQFMQGKMAAMDLKTIPKKMIAPFFLCYIIP